MDILAGRSQYIMLCNDYSFKVMVVAFSSTILIEYTARDRVSQSSHLIIVDSRTQSAP